MRLCVSLLLVGGLTMCPAGCGTPDNGNGSVTNNGGNGDLPGTTRSEPMTVILEGVDQFPPGMVGTWKANDSAWGFVFEPDGKLSSVRISLGGVRIKPGETLRAKTLSNGEAVFTPGSWTVHYIGETQTLTVRIVLDGFRVEMGENVLSGATTDIFVGPISQDGKVWQTEQTSFPKYTAKTDQGVTDLPYEQTYGISQIVIFEKVSE